MLKQEKQEQLNKILLWKISKFTTETKVLILIRDRKCILCKKEWWKIKWIMDYHHIYFWPHQTEYNNEKRNDVTRWVWLCKEHHYEIHHWIKWKWIEYRSYCIEYLKNLYKI